MAYSATLKKLFPGITLEVTDLLMLESFQIGYLPQRMPHQAFATLIHQYPWVKDFLLAKHPPITTFIDTILKANPAIRDESLINPHCQEALWEVADLIVYAKYPHIYDKQVDFPWQLNEITDLKSLAGKRVADVGAGSGKLAFLLSEYAESVFAIEPAAPLRAFMRKKAARDQYRNVHVMDGFLDSIPFPDHFFDILFTSNAIGWNLEQELLEIERVVKPQGRAVHLMSTIAEEPDTPLHKVLTSDKWKYKFRKIQDQNGFRGMYMKTMAKINPSI